MEEYNEANLASGYLQGVRDMVYLQPIKVKRRQERELEKCFSYTIDSKDAFCPTK